jgi:hypothetical protein
MTERVSTFDCQFRSTNGLYAKLSEEHPEITDPQEMFGA